MDDAELIAAVATARTEGWYDEDPKWQPIDAALRERGLIDAPACDHREGCTNWYGLPASEFFECSAPGRSICRRVAAAS